MKIIVTGGCGFIGSELIIKLIALGHKVLNIDCITKSSIPESLEIIKKNPNYKFSKTNICDKNIYNLIKSYKPNKIVHLAAESHVDTSIESPDNFISTNILGTYNLLISAKKYYENNRSIQNNFSFLHVSTDEVYGSLTKKSKPSLENNSFLPNSPYSASKASSDLLVRSWNKTYNFPTLTTNCCNNYGKFQFPEKLIPKVIFSIIKKNIIKVYGNGKNIREWIYVEDHVNILIELMYSKKYGETFNIGSGFEISNIKLVNMICNYLDKKLNLKKSSKNLIRYTTDRKGHDFRYSLNSDKVFRETNYDIKNNFRTNLYKTIDWYYENRKLFLSKYFT